MEGKAKTIVSLIESLNHHSQKRCNKILNKLIFDINNKIVNKDHGLKLEWIKLLFKNPVLCEMIDYQEILDIITAGFKETKVPTEESIKSLINPVKKESKNKKDIYHENRDKEHSNSFYQSKKKICFSFTRGQKCLQYDKCTLFHKCIMCLKKEKSVYDCDCDLINQYCLYFQMGNCKRENCHFLHKCSICDLSLIHI